MITTIELIIFKVNFLIVISNLMITMNIIINQGFQMINLIV